MLIGLGIAVEKSNAGNTSRGRVTAGINLRAAPGLAGKVITGLEAGTLITITDEQSGWYQIAYEDDAYGYRGWVYGRYIERFSATPVAQNAATAGTEYSQPAPAATVPASEPLLRTRAAAGDIRVPLPDMPTNTIELIQASAAPNAAVTQPAPQNPPPQTKSNQPAAGLTPATEKTVPQPATGMVARKKQAPSNPEPVIKSLSPDQTTTASSPGSGFLLSLVLKISSVFLSCLALMISYRTFHLVTASGKLQ